MSPVVGRRVESCCSGVWIGRMGGRLLALRTNPTRLRRRRTSPTVRSHACARSFLGMTAPPFKTFYVATVMAFPTSSVRFGLSRIMSRLSFREASSRSNLMDRKSRPMTTTCIRCRGPKRSSRAWEHNRCEFGSPFPISSNQVPGDEDGAGNFGTQPGH